MNGFVEPQTWRVVQLNNPLRSSCHGAAEMNLTSIHEDSGSIPNLAQWVRGSGIAMSCGVGHRGGLDPRLLWLWCRLAAAAGIQLLT